MLIPSWDNLFFTFVMTPKLVQEFHPKGNTLRRRVLLSILIISNFTMQHLQFNVWRIISSKYYFICPVHSDVAPSDVYLFGTVKHRLEGCMGKTVEDLTENVSEILKMISEEELIAAFLNWIERLQQVIDNIGNYIECGLYILYLVDFNVFDHLQNTRTFQAMECTRVQ
jgi:hypothetical protein